MTAMTIQTTIQSKVKKIHSTIAIITQVRKLGKGKGGNMKCRQNMCINHHFNILFLYEKKEYYREWSLLRLHCYTLSILTLYSFYCMIICRRFKWQNR